MCGALSTQPHFRNRPHSLLGVVVAVGIYKGEGSSGRALTQLPPMKNKQRNLKEMSTSSVNSFMTSSPEPFSSPKTAVPVLERGIGLSDPDQSANRRKVLGLVDRLHNTG